MGFPCRAWEPGSVVCGPLLAALLACSLAAPRPCFAQLQYGEDVGNVEVETKIIRGDAKLENGEWQRRVDAYRATAKVPEDQRLKLSIVPWFDPSKGIRRMIQTITPLDDKGMPHGEVHTFRPLVRQPIHVVTYRHGVRHGTEKQWAGVHGNDIRLRAEIPWQNGEVHGDRIMYHPNGKVMTTTKYVRGKETGESRSFDPEGRTERTVTFKGGKKHGELKDYWPETGKLRRVIPYHNGKVEGLVREYYSDGTKKREVPLKNDAMHGVERVYNADGKQIETRYWIDGEPVDEAEFKERFKK